MGEEKNTVEFNNAFWARVYAHAWVDDEFRKKLETDPAGALESYIQDVLKLKREDVCFKIPSAPPGLEANDALKDFVDDGKLRCIELVACC